MIKFFILLFFLYCQFFLYSHDQMIERLQNNLASNERTAQNRFYMHLIENMSTMNEMRTIQNEHNDIINRLKLRIKLKRIDESKEKIDFYKEYCSHLPQDIFFSKVVEHNLIFLQSFDPGKNSDLNFDVIDVEKDGIIGKFWQLK
ncbi:MAG: hypothetical protein HEEMFOPI_01434 [Holosporales bacterium]